MVKHALTLALILCFFSCVLHGRAAQAQLNGHTWFDDAGNVLEAHGGGFLFVNDTYYWYGETNKAQDYTVHGFNCYSSTDLIKWHFEGEVVNQGTITFDKPGPYRLERPKVLYNDKTQKYVMWFHLDTPAFAYHTCGVAVSDSPTSPFKFVRGVQADGWECGDVQLYKDDDGIGYLIRALAASGIGISPLTDDFLNTTGITSRINSPLEGPVVFKYNGNFYIIVSQRTGWNPNAMSLYAGGPSLKSSTWTYLGNPTGSATSFNSQPTDVTVFNGTLIYQGDRWNNQGPGGLNNASYVWLPILPTNNGNFKIFYEDSWTA